MPLPRGFRLLEEEDAPRLPVGFRMLSEPTERTERTERTDSYLPRGFNLLSEDKPPEDTRTPTEKLLASLERGFKGSVAGLLDIPAGITAIPERLGLWEKSGEYPGADLPAEWAASLREGMPEKPGGIGYTAAEIAASLPLTLAKYLPAARVARGAGLLAEAAGMGATDVGGALGRGEDWDTAAKEGAIGAATGATLGALGGLKAPVRAAIAAPAGYVLSAVGGGEQPENLTNAVVMGALSGLLPQTTAARAKAPIKQRLEQDLGDIAKRKAEVTGQINPEIGMAPPPREPVYPSVADETLGGAATDPRIMGKPPERPINFQRLGLTDDLKYIVANQLDDSAREVLARQGKVPWEETNLRALEYPMERLAEELGTPGTSSARNMASRNWHDTMVTARGEIEDKLRNAIQSGAPADEIAALQEDARLAVLAHVNGILLAKGYSAEAGRGLQIYNQMSRTWTPAEQFIMKLSRRGKLDRELVTRILSLDKNDVAGLEKIAREEFKPGAGQYGYEIWLNGLLSSPKTHIVNSTSNALTQAMSLAERPVAAATEAVRSAVTGTPRERFFGEIGADFKGLVKGILNGVTALNASRRGEIFQSKLDHVRAIPGQVKGIPVTPGHILGMEDEFFKAVAATREAYVQAYRKARMQGAGSVEALGKIDSILGDLGQQKDILKAMRKKYNQAKLKGFTGQALDDLDEITNAALDAAETQTFTKEAGEITKRMLAIREAAPILKIFLPFVQTPVNITKYAVRHTPFSPDLYRSLKSGGSAASDEIAKVTIGSLIGGVAALMAADGTVTGGGPADPKLKNNLLATGWQPYSAKIGDKYYSFERLEPLATLAGLSADLQEAKGPRERDHLVKKIVMTVSDNLTNKTFMQGVENLVRLWSDPDRYGEQVMRSMIGSVVPSVVGAVARAEDPTVRDVKLDTAEDVGGVIASRIPGAAETLPARVSVTGREITRPGTPASRLLSPVEVSKERPDAVLEREFNRLGFVPSKAKRQKTLIIDDVKTNITLSRDDISQLDAADKLAASYLERLVTSPQWQNADPRLNPEKIKLIKKTYDQVRTPVLNRIRAKYLFTERP